MGAVTDEFIEELTAWRSAYKDDPDAMLRQLLLVGLEREQIVSVALRDQFMLRRIRQLHAPADIKRMIEFALRWAWKDEEMHATYVRGKLLQAGHSPEVALTYMSQISGAIGGWASSTTQHFQLHQAPFAWILARSIILAGVVAQKVPLGVLKELNYRTFHQFSQYNIEAEATAALAWKELVDLIQANWPENIEFLRHAEIMYRDETAHEQLFTLFTEIIDPNDRLVTGVEVDFVRDRIAKINEYFLPPEDRKVSLPAAPVYCFESESSEFDRAKCSEFQSYLESLDSAGCFSKLKQTENATVAIKVNLMLGYHKRQRGVIVDVDLLRVLATFLKSLGAARIFVLDCPAVYQEFCDNREVEAVAEYFQMSCDSFEVVSVLDDLVPHQFERGMACEEISRHWLEADFRLNFGRLRSHPVDLMFAGLANLEGLVGLREKFLFAERLADRQTPTLMLVQDVPPDLTVVDAYENLPDGLAGVLGSRRRTSPGRFYASTNVLATDLVIAAHFRQPIIYWSEFYRNAVEWFGTPELVVEGCDDEFLDWIGPRANKLTAMLSTMAFPLFSHFSRRGLWFLPEIDQQAFPLKSDVTWYERQIQRFTQSVLGLPKILKSEQKN